MTITGNIADQRERIHGTGLRFDTRYTQLPAAFHHGGEPSPAPDPTVVVVNHALAEELGLRLQDLSPEEQAALFSGRALAEGSTPFSQAYAGHQFGGFAVLGDGRAHVLGEHVTPDRRRVDVQLKGSGRTPYSRGGDGLATLGPMLREYLVSEAMAALNVPTTRSLAVVRTGARVLRNGPEPGAVLTRVAASHIRVGTFQFAACLEDSSALRDLVRYTIARHYPTLTDAPSSALALWDEVAERQAALVISWMRVGFVHGVMNTDNTTVSGETIDYGPCAFLDEYASGKTFSSIDRHGRYAFGNQPGILCWNMARFAEALLPLLDADRDRAIALAEERIARLAARLSEAWTEMMREKLGLPGRDADDSSLATGLLELMEETAADYTDSFRALSGDTPIPPALERARGWETWRCRWDDRCGRARGDGPDRGARDRMRAVNPAVIPRNHLVEEALSAAVDREDLGAFHRLLSAVRAPYEERPELAPFQEPPPASFRSYKTFCGT